MGENFMLFVSTRKQLGNEDEIGGTSYWDVDIANGVQQSATELPDVEAVKQRLKDKAILILVHGYNNEFEDIVRAYSIIESRVKLRLSDWYDEVVGFTWPGGSNPLDWYEPKRRAGVIAPRLATFIRDIQGTAFIIDVMSHSLGGRVALSAMTAIPQDSVRANFLTASAVDNEVLEPGQKYHVSVKLGARESVVFHSRKDLVLRTAYRVAEWDNPLGLHGPENPGEIMRSLPEVYVANCKNVIDEHGDYKSKSAIYSFINSWLSGQVSQQFSTL